MTDQAEQEVDTEVVDAFNQFYNQYYDERIRELPELYADDDTPSLSIDYRELESFDKDLAKALNSNPGTFYYSGVRALQEYLDNDKLSEADLRLSYHNEINDNVINIRNIRSKHINRLVSVEGIVKTSSMVLPRVTKARFICRSCNTGQYEDQPISPSSLQYPYECQNENCNVKNKNAFKLDKRESERVDFQKIVVEEPPEDLRGGQNPQSVNCYIRGDITGDVTPGDRIAITGILRADNSNDNPVLTHFLEANQIQKKEQEFEEIEIADEDKKRIEELSNRDDLYNVIMNSVAPSIYGYEDQKMAVAMQLFSGVTKDAPDTHIRGDIHCLMVGDPGTGKSEIIQSAKELAPRGVYAVGKGASAAGLTATAVKDSDMSGDQKWSLEAGALVLADKGIACIDEIDKMSNDDRSSLHEALEQQTVSVNKAGINATLKSRCSLLAAANPTYGRFDEYEAIAEQIDLEPALISRFDLIFTIQDKPDPEVDANIAEHLLDINEAAMHEMQGDVIPTEEGERDDVFDDALDPELLRKYIAYARQNCNPIVTGEQKEKIKSFYTDLRDQGDDDSPIAVTARAVQSMIRLSEAVARMRLGDEVTEEDIKKAISIKEASLQDVGVDPVTGELDADAIESGTTKTQRDQKRSFETILKELTEEYPSEGAPFEEIVERAEEEAGMDEDEVEDELGNLQRRGEVMNPSGNRWSYINRN